ncbi:response regulator [Methylotenera sp. G11]|uniref:response regulator n=1 Tax=Methylotenera sp. G11 TaxID=1506585 RepID=UPI0006484FC4|nr:response regulator [Methylotenera sp. G11]
MKLMIVDDSNIIRSRISRIMTDAKLPPIEIVGTAGNGTDAFALFTQERPELVTMDLTMPEMDGVECTTLLVEFNPEVKILIVSALSDKATAIEALKNGASGFLYKPFTDEELVNALLELIKE